MQKFSVKGHELEEQIGRGAGSWIFRARSLTDGQRVAVKIVIRARPADDPFVRQVKNEYKVGSALDHPHLVKVLAFEHIQHLLRPSEYRLFLEYVDGPTLEHYRYRELATLLNLFSQVAQALDYMHSQGYVHADVKPSNILVKPGLVAKLLDFGLACPKGIQKSRIQGTADFIAPEQVNRGFIDERTDVYNFAATMYRVLTGRNIPSFLGIKGEIYFSHRLRIIPVRQLNPDIPQVLEAIIMRSLAREKEKRPSSMVEVCESLTKISEKLSPKTK